LYPDQTVLSRLKPGDAVQTPLGKGIVREVRNAGRLMVEVDGRVLVVAERDLSPVQQVKARSRERVTPTRRIERPPPKSDKRTASAQVDLHGLTVEEALERVDQALSEALLADLSELRFIHGRGGGRIRAALHRRLRETSAVRKFLVDPRNEGVTIVVL
jgi:DNA mismatch repair protein MutS2